VLGEGLGFAIPGLLHNAAFPDRARLQRAIEFGKSNGLTPDETIQHLLDQKLLKVTPPAKDGGQPKIEFQSEAGKRGILRQSPQDKAAEAGMAKAAPGIIDDWNRRAIAALRPKGWFPVQPESRIDFTGKPLPDIGLRTQEEEQYDKQMLDRQMAYPDRPKEEEIPAATTIPDDQVAGILGISGVSSSRTFHTIRQWLRRVVTCKNLHLQM